MRKHSALIALLAAVSLVLSACQGDKTKAAKPELPNPNPYPSTYQLPATEPTLIQNATVLDGLGKQWDKADVLLQNGKIQQIATDISPPAGAQLIDAQGQWLTPGFIDVHSHLGLYPAPETANHADGNEMTSPVTAEVWAEHSVWPGDPQFEKVLAGGVTTLQVLPGSGNLIGGRGVTLKNIPAITVQAMKFPDAPYSLKMACGENPKAVYGEKGVAPSTRMGNMAGFRAAWIQAKAYQKSWQDYVADTVAGEEVDAPERNLQMETLAAVLDGQIRIHNHCYRADEMAQMIDMSKEFGYSIAAFHHGVEAYKVAPLLAQENICAVVWADWWGFKQEAYDMVPENLALLEHAQACAIIHSDDPIQAQRLNQEIAKAMAAGNRMGMNISRAQAIRWVTSNAAISLGLEDQVGAIAAGKNADLVLWDGDPFSVYSHSNKVWIDGKLRYDRNNPAVAPTSDFNLGMLQGQENLP
ncbi:amidohydrolase [Dasania sp. GY-MA-18]|uniref:Amidohydrolase n=1 Tax=Dasania phycosphaerae TaxID=2950436 RepID=A0A9J6RRZ3_9GAMM|nr:MULTISPECIES: amidohydrolase [Dasania]MCR8924282.1 amidohydrolase [Dasania sp. GY-MA-18]MCZ0866935.1 amidohydrolase [Dasania phycosphaerae]MCZ0870439.1 amidohydrolase [Dasania phycosphaerae]